MTSFAALAKKIGLKFQLSRSDAVMVAALLLSALAIVIAAAMAEARSKNRNDRTSDAKVTASVLLSATEAGANAVTAVGERAKLINASLPFDTGPVEAARPFIIGEDESDYPRAFLCLRAAVYHEAGFEPQAGRRAVAQVILNRLRHSAFPKSVCEVVYQGAATPVCQFSFACDVARHRPVAAIPWEEAGQIAAQALAGYVEASVGTATHYHADYVAPRWAPLLTKISQIGLHIFYRWPGSWGKRPAFLRRYLGEEASAIGRAMELEAATAAALQITGGRGIELVALNDGAMLPVVSRGDPASRGSKSATGMWDVGAHEELIAATLAGRLVERGLVSWDTPMRELFPDLGAHMAAKLQSITLTQLLSDPAIFPAKTDPGYAVSLPESADETTVQRADFIRNALNSVGRQPSGSGLRQPRLVIAAAALEGVTGLHYERLVQDEIFKPLRMRTAGFMTSRMHDAKAAQSRPEGTVAPLKHAGAMRVGLSDFGAFLIDQLQGGLGKGKLLTPANYRRLHKFAQIQPAREDKWPDCSRQALGGLMHAVGGSYWIAGLNMGGNRGRALIVTGLPEGQNKLAAFSRKMESVQPAAARSGSVKGRRCPSSSGKLPV